MIRNKLFLALAGGGILLVGLVTGALLSGGFPAWAFGSSATPTPGTATKGNGQYCQLYEQTLANELHVSQSTLESANQDAIKAVIQQAYKDGKITQTEETNLLNRASAMGTHGCAGMRFGFGHGRGGFGPQLAGARQAILNAVAGRLGITAATLQSDLASGQTIAQIATAKNVPLTGSNGVNAAYLSAVQAQLNQAVSAGTITQAQSTRLYSMAQQGVASGHYPLLEPAHGGHKPPTG